MKKILLMDDNMAFTTDVESRLILDGIEDTDIVVGSNFDNVSAELSRENPAELLISAKLIPLRSDWDFGIPVKCYARSNEDIAVANEKNIPCYGITNTARELLSAVESGKLLTVTGHAAAAKSAPASNPELQKTDTPEKDMFADVQATKAEHTETTQMPPLQQPSPAKNSLTYQERAVTNKLQSNFGANPDNQYAQSLTTAPESVPVSSHDIRAKLAEAKRREKEEEERRQMALRKQQKDDVAYAVERDMGNVRLPARVITVYSAKGGVGKTTISCELATFLALTSHGRGKFKVCIADFNIDFGDVLNTLSFDPERSCMTYWAADIQSKLDVGQQPEEIRYTEAQMSVYLQKNEKDGLCALIAPMTNEDSMDITEQQIEIMLDNLIQYGGFDFVICDTGNNTRDSSIISLEKAEEVLLVMTQDVNTANCNNSFLSTMHKIGFDMNKFRLVINKARPAKSVAISTDELMEVFVNPMTGQPYPCIAKIKDDNEVKHANNLGEPLVYHSSHEFTKSIGNIAKEIIGDNFVLGEPEKKGFFGKLFGGGKKK